MEKTRVIVMKILNVCLDSDVGDGIVKELELIQSWIVVHKLFVMLLPMIQIAVQQISYAGSVKVIAIWIATVYLVLDVETITVELLLQAQMMMEVALIAVLINLVHPLKMIPIVARKTFPVMLAKEIAILISNVCLDWFVELITVEQLLEAQILMEVPLIVAWCLCK